MNNINYNTFIVAIDDIATKYNESGRFSDTFMSALKESLKDRDLRIAVIGKMKAGKSTFTNALIFQDNILPSGVEPTTVTLTEICYLDSQDKDSEVEVELLTEDDVEEIKKNQNDANPKKADAAKQILNELSKVPGGYEQYVHKEKNVIKIGLDDLVKYTSVGGKLCGLAKKVIIKKKVEALKGVTIIDTPGFNDPISSRGEATKTALKDCNIIFFLHDYLDKYDQDEISILTEQVEYTGVSEIVDVINRMDMNEDISISEWPSFVSKFVRKKEEAKKQIASSDISKLLEESKTTFVSSLMALIGYSIRNSRFDEKEKGKRGLSNFILDEDTKSLFLEFQSYFQELKNETDFIYYSHIAEIINIINELTENKSRYLSEYPLSMVIGQLKNVIAIIEQEKSAKQEELNALQLTVTEAQGRINALNAMFAPLKTLVKTSNLPSVIRNDINATKQKIQHTRSEKVPEEFTDKNYLKIVIGDFGRKKRNLARYQNFVFDFDDIIRNELEGLKNKVILDSETYIKSLGAKLVNNQVSMDDRQSFVDALIRAAHNILDEISIDLDPNVPSSPLDGEQEQYALYKGDFMDRYRDTKINEILTNFYNACTLLEEEFLSDVRKEIATMQTMLRDAINFDPKERQEKIDIVNGEIENLEKEKISTEEDMKKLVELKQNSK